MPDGAHTHGTVQAAGGTHDGPTQFALGRRIAGVPRLACRTNMRHTPMMPAFHRTTLLTLALAATATAQNLSLDRTGGAIGGSSTFPILGQPGEIFALVIAYQEVPTPIPGIGLTLDISDELANVTYTTPGWFGVLNAQGRATPNLTLPNWPILDATMWSLQAVAGTSTFRKSNLVRLTPQLPGTFKPTLGAPAAPILTAGGWATAPDNELLFLGGSGPVAQRYKVRTEEWELAGASLGVGILAQTTGLADGRVLFTGGLDLTTGQPTAAASVYDPVTQVTTPLTMAAPRAGHGASLMPNGRVLITGGSTSFDLTNPLSLFTGLLGSSEFFDPVTNTFLPGPNMLEPRAFHTSTTLTTGRVLVAGGIATIPFVNIPNVSNTAYLFNPTTNSFGLPSLFSGGRFLHSATQLSNGRVLLVGGLTLDLTTFLQTLNIADLIIGTRTDCQLFAPSAFGFGSFTTVNGMQTGRAGAAAAPLANGGALIAGGFALTINPSTSQFEFALTETADRFTQAPNAIAPVGSMAAPRLFGAALPLPDGTVMVVGGGPTNAEIFQN